MRKPAFFPLLLLPESNLTLPSSGCHNHAAGLPACQSTKHFFSPFTNDYTPDLSLVSRETIIIVFNILSHVLHIVVENSLDNFTILVNFGQFPLPPEQNRASFPHWFHITRCLCRTSTAPDYPSSSFLNIELSEGFSPRVTPAPRLERPDGFLEEQRTLDTPLLPSVNRYRGKARRSVGV